jgi:hypothetical protein
MLSLFLSEITILTNSDKQDLGNNTMCSKRSLVSGCDRLKVLKAVNLRPTASVFAPARENLLTHCSHRLVPWELKSGVDRCSLVWNQLLSIGSVQGDVAKRFPTQRKLGLDSMVR